MRSFTSRKSDSVRAIFSPSLLFTLLPSPGRCRKRQRGTLGSGSQQPVRFVVRESWPEPVERVAAYLRSAGAEARLEELESGTATAEDAARAAGCPIDQIVKSIVVLCDGRPVVALVPGDRRADLDEDRTGRRRGQGPDRARARGRGGDGLRARLGRSLSAAERRSRADRPDPARPRHALGRRRLRHAHGRHEPERPRPARPRAADGRRRRLCVRCPVRKETLDARDRDDLDERRVHRLGRREGARRRARAPLRHRRLRGHPLLRDPRRPGRLPAQGAPAAAPQLGRAPLHGAAVHGRRDSHAPRTS